MNTDKDHWEVQYTFGADWRISIFKFKIDKKLEKPIVKFVGEQPMLQYVSVYSRMLC